MQFCTSPILLQNRRVIAPQRFGRSRWLTSEVKDTFVTVGDLPHHQEMVGFTSPLLDLGQHTRDTPVRRAALVQRQPLLLPGRRAFSDTTALISKRFSPLY